MQEEKPKRGRPTKQSADTKHGRLLTDHEVAERLGITFQHLRNCRSLGKPVPDYVKMGRLVRTSERAVEAFIEQQTVKVSARDGVNVAV